MCLIQYYIAMFRGGGVAKDFTCVLVTRLIYSPSYLPYGLAVGMDQDSFVRQQYYFGWV